MLNCGSPPFSDQNPVALVTGAAGILGPDICRSLSAQGWRVAATDLSPNDFDLTHAHQNLRTFSERQFTGDLADKAFCHLLVKEVEGALGPIKLLINNAAVNLPETAFGQIDEAAAIRIFRVNVLAPFWLVQAAEPSLLSQKGVIINISSAQTAGWRPNNHLYISSKAALEKLTESLSAHFGESEARCVGIRVGSVPGIAFLRDFLRQLPPSAARDMVDEILPRHYENGEHALGRGRVGNPQDVAKLVTFLASEGARLINGDIITLDGGFTRLPRDWVGQRPIDIQETARQWFERWQINHSHDAA